MIHRQVTVTDPAGVHARTAQELVLLAKSFSCSIFLRQAGRTATLREPIGILARALPHGATVEVWADGADEQDALAAVADHLSSSSNH